MGHNGTRGNTERADCDLYDAAIYWTLFCLKYHVIPPLFFEEGSFLTRYLIFYIQKTILAVKKPIFDVQYFSCYIQGICRITSILIFYNKEIIIDKNIKHYGNQKNELFIINSLPCACMSDGAKWTGQYGTHISCLYHTYSMPITYRCHIMTCYNFIMPMP